MKRLALVLGTRKRLAAAVLVGLPTVVATIILAKCVGIVGGKEYVSVHVESAQLHRIRAAVLAEKLATEFLSAKCAIVYEGGGGSDTERLQETLSGLILGAQCRLDIRAVIPAPLDLPDDEHGVATLRYSDLQTAVEDQCPDCSLVVYAGALRPSDFSKVIWTGDAKPFIALLYSPWTPTADAMADSPIRLAVADRDSFDGMELFMRRQKKYGRIPQNQYKEIFDECFYMVTAPGCPCF